MIIDGKSPESKFFPGIIAFDEKGQQIPAVMEMNTETLLCKCGTLGRVVVAAGFVITPFPALYDRLPDGLFPFVIPIP